MNKRDPMKSNRNRPLDFTYRPSVDFAASRPSPFSPDMPALVGCILERDRPGLSGPPASSSDGIASWKVAS